MCNLSGSCYVYMRVVAMLLRYVCIHALDERRRAVSGSDFFSSVCVDMR